jgi:hypothetical protein
MELTKDQIKLVETEARIYRVFNENYILEFSSKLWNKYKIGVRVYFKNGEYWKAEEI